MRVSSTQTYFIQPHFDYKSIACRSRRTNASSFSLRFFLPASERLEARFFRLLSFCIILALAGRAYTLPLVHFCTFPAEKKYLAIVQNKLNTRKRNIFDGLVSRARSGRVAESFHTAYEDSLFGNGDIFSNLYWLYSQNWLTCL
ncbi:hypothetical protein L596_003923 [Steinernema carpocapsae]|uniref:Uncharacterized protein n=1 Tax=Steinernema carpocapsae TaxID=34508 RepID=A0A4U8UXG6_STECR|nr:hypothetical protein L596_003923 [Steinernema carpocapsae]